MKLAFGQNCSCGALIVTRTIYPERIIAAGRYTRGMVIEETCANGHLASFTAEKITMTELAKAAIQASEPLS